MVIQGDMLRQEEKEDLQVEGKGKDGEITGKNVAKAFEDGRIKEICEYCEKDVELTRKIYNRLTFSD